MALYGFGNFIRLNQFFTKIIPSKIAERKCVIILTPDNKKQQANVETGDLTKFEVLDLLEGIQKVLARELVEEAESMVGKDPKRVEAYLDSLRQNNPKQNN